MGKQSKAPTRRARPRHMRVVATVDRRTIPARRHAALVCDFLAQVGPGPHSEATLALCRRAGALVMELDGLDAGMLRGEGLDAVKYCRLANTLARTFQRLGLATGDGEERD